MRDKKLHRLQSYMGYIGYKGNGKRDAGGVITD
jgi:hypothetical protein